MPRPLDQVLRELLRNQVRELVLSGDLGGGFTNGTLEIGTTGPKDNGMFPVKVTRVPPEESEEDDAGSLTTKCDFVYDVTDIFGRPLGSAMSPAYDRPALGKYVPAPDGSYGTGFYNEDNEFVLWMVREHPDQGTDCGVESGSS